MILYAKGNGLYEVKLAFLDVIEIQVEPRCFTTSEQLISFLKNYPNHKFAIMPEFSIALGNELTQFSSSAAYGPQFGDVLCGVVTYDPVKDQVLTVGVYYPGGGGGPGAPWAG